MLRIGILQADSVLPQFQAEHGNYPGMISAVISRAAEALGVAVTFQTYDVEHGEYPDALDECDGYVITGSKKSVYDPDDWIVELKDYVKEIAAAKTPLVGLCFGHQLVAEALGGKTEPAAVGWGVGIHASEVDHSQANKSGWFMEPAPDHFNLIVSHKDQVSALPEGADRLASSDFCPNSMFVIGDHVFAMQGHPEFDRAYSSDLMHMRQEILGDEKFRRGVASLEMPLHRDDVARWIVRFLKGRQTASELLP